MRTNEALGTFTGPLHFAAISVCFALSGFAALLLQIVWTRQLVFLFGSSSLAVAMVLSGYMGGLAVGAAIAARFAPYIRRPLLVYGLLEVAIGALALAMPTAIWAVGAIVEALFGGNPELAAEGGAGAGLIYVLGSFAMLLLPTACMGATLPLLTRFVVRQKNQIGSRVGGLYAANTIGAVLGALGAGFWLIPMWGLSRTVYVGVAVNFAVFGIALLLGRGGRISDQPQVRPAQLADCERRGWILPLLLLSGAASFSYEVLWTRLIGQLLGSNLYAFAAMLASFLAGIALGSAVAARLATGSHRAIRGFSLAQVGIAFLSLAVYLVLDWVPGWIRAADSQRVEVWAGVAVAVALLLPSAVCIGATFPFAVRWLARDPVEAPAASARAYAWNTVGSIAGAVGTGFFAIPLLGFKGVITICVLVNIALAIGGIQLVGPGRTRRTLGAIAVAMVVVCLLWKSPEPWRLYLSSPLHVASSVEQRIYHGHGRSATVSVVQTKAGMLEVRNNGLAEAQIRRPGEVESLANTWLAGVASMLRPEAKEMLVVGYGGGSMLETVPSMVTSIDVVELERQVLLAAREIAKYREVDPLQDPRISLVLHDVRSALMLTDKRWDIVASQPSHPFTEMASHLYTRDFFELVRAHLKVDGIFVQWLGLMFVSDELLPSVIATLADVFKYVQVYRPHRVNEIYLVASDEPMHWNESSRRFVDRDGLNAQRMGIIGPEDVLLALALEGEAVDKIVQGGAIFSDDFNPLEHQHLSKLGNWNVTSNIQQLQGYAPINAQVLEGLDTPYLVRRLLTQGRIDQARLVHQYISNEAARQAIAGMIALTVGQSDNARQLIEAAIRSDPQSTEARGTYLLLRLLGLASKDSDNDLLLLNESERKVATANHLYLAQKFDDLAQLDALLAGLSPRHPAYVAVARLRAFWRIEVADKDRAHEAIQICNSIIPLTQDHTDYLWRARALAVAGSFDDAGRALLQVLRSTRIHNREATQARELRRMAEAVISLLPDTGNDHMSRRVLQQAIESVFAGP